MACGFVVRCAKRKASAFPMDQALEKAYKKPAKGSIRVADISSRKMLHVDGTPPGMRR